MPGLLKTRDTVATDVPARRATSAMLMNEIVFCKRFHFTRRT
jgi:hypothetical protein